MYMNMDVYMDMCMDMYACVCRVVGGETVGRLKSKQSSVVCVVYRVGRPRARSAGAKGNVSTFILPTFAGGVTVSVARASDRFFLSSQRFGSSVSLRDPVPCGS